MHSSWLSSRHLCRGADADSFGPSVQKIIEILQLRFIDKVVDVCCAGPAVLWMQSWRRQPSSQSCSPLSMDTVVAMPVVVQRQLPGGSDVRKTAKVPQLQYILYAVDVLVVQVHLGSSSSRTRSLTCPLCSTTGFLRTVKVPQIQFIAGVFGHSCCATETGTHAFSSGGYGGDEGFFRPFRAFFALVQVVLELSASFRSPRWRRVLCHRGLLHNFILSTCRHGHSA